MFKGQLSVKVFYCYWTGTFQ